MGEVRTLDGELLGARQASPLDDAGPRHVRPRRDDRHAGERTSTTGAEGPGVLLRRASMTPRFPKKNWEIVKIPDFPLIFHENPSNLIEKQ